MQTFSECVDRHKKLIEEAYQFIWTHPETGYKEWETHKYLAEKYRALGYTLTEAGDIPGFYTDIDTGKPGPTILVMGELDALSCPNHQEAVNGNAHACGHAAQSAGLLGLAAALTEPETLEGLCGKIRLMATPAEELIEVEFREGLRKKGIIKYFGGKPEFMRRGYMDGVDAAVMLHTTSGRPAHTGYINGGANGMVTFIAEFEGVASHAGGSPQNGINALYAANQGLSAINAIRETFSDKAHIRVHPIMTAGGSSVNIIPDHVVLESYVRANDMDVVQATMKKVARALAGAAASIGAGLKLHIRPGYFTRNDDPGMMLAMKEAMESTLENTIYEPQAWGTGSTDLGDIASVIPSVHAYMSGAEGKGHGADYRVFSIDSACVDAAKVQLAFLRILLSDGAARAKKIIEESTPRFESKEAYYEYVDAMAADLDAVKYNEDGSITLL